MKVRKEFIVELHEVVGSKAKGMIENEFPKLFPKIEYEVGKWYHQLRDPDRAVRYSGMHHNKKSMVGYGFSTINEKFTESDDMTWGDYDDWVLIPHDKLEKLFIKEAERRGLKNGNFKSVLSGIQASCGNPPKYHSFDDTFYIGGYCCYSKGKWAEPIETITKAEAEKQLNKKIID